MKHWLYNDTMQLSDPSKNGWIVEISTIQGCWEVDAFSDIGLIWHAATLGDGAFRLIIALLEGMG
jgi:hypothetical protein